MNVNTEIRDRFRQAVALYTGDMGALMADTSAGQYDSGVPREVFIPTSHGPTKGLPTEKERVSVGECLHTIYPIHFWLGRQEYILWHDPTENVVHWTEGRRREVTGADRRVEIYQ